MSIIKMTEAEVEFRLTVFELLVKNIIINDEQPWFIKNLIAKMRKVYELLSQNDEFAAQQSRLQAWIEQLSWVDPVFCKPEDEVSFRLKVYRQVTSHLYRNYSSKTAINLLGKMADFSCMDIMYSTTDAQKRELVEIARPFGMMVCERELAEMKAITDIDTEVAKNLIDSVLKFYTILYISDKERDEILSVMENINSCIIKKKPQVFEELIDELEDKMACCTDELEKLSASALLILGYTTVAERKKPLDMEYVAHVQGRVAYLSEQMERIRKKAGLK